MSVTYSLSDAWLLLAIAGASAPARGASVRDVIAVGDYLNRAVFTFEEFDSGLARLRAGKLASVRGREPLQACVAHAQDAGRKYISVASYVLAGEK